MGKKSFWLRQRKREEGIWWSFGCLEGKWEGDENTTEDGQVHGAELTIVLVQYTNQIEWIGRIEREGQNIEEQSR